MQLLPDKPGGLALMDPFPVSLLGLQHFIRGIDQKSEIVFQSGSIKDIHEKLLYQPVAVLVTELYSCNETVSEVRERLLTLCAQLPSLRVIVYTQCQESAELVLLLDTPAISLISRNDNIQLAQGLFTQAFNGQRIISPMMHSYLERKKKADVSLERLTRSECAVLAFLFNGKSLQEIANIKQCSIKTISTHKCSAMRKLKVNNNSELFSLKKTLFRDLPVNPLPPLNASGRQAEHHTLSQPDFL